jgi:hypothetical protein
MRNMEMRLRWDQREGREKASMCSDFVLGMGWATEGLLRFRLCPQYLSQGKGLLSSMGTTASVLLPASEHMTC